MNKKGPSSLNSDEPPTEPTVEIERFLSMRSGVDRGKTYKEKRHLIYKRSRKLTRKRLEKLQFVCPKCASYEPEPTNWFIRRRTTPCCRGCGSVSVSGVVEVLKWQPVDTILVETKAFRKWYQASDFKSLKEVSVFLQTGYRTVLKWFSSPPSFIQVKNPSPSLKEQKFTHWYWRCENIYSQCKARGISSTKLQKSFGLQAGQVRDNKIFTEEERARLDVHFCL